MVDIDEDTQKALLLFNRRAEAQKEAAAAAKRLAKAERAKDEAAAAVQQAKGAEAVAEAEAAWREAGVDEFVHARSDVLDVLGRLLDDLGVAR